MTEKVNALMSDIDARLHQKNMFTDHLETLEKKTGVRRLYLVAGIVNILMSLNLGLAKMLGSS